MKTAKTTIDSAEVEKFSRIADEWWDEKGKFKPLHQMNPVRIGYIREQAIKHFGLPDDLTLFKGLKFLDIGCGGGLLSEPIARLGADVTGVDASAQNIGVAKAHAAKSGVKVNYVNSTAEEVAATGKKFDVILNMEVIEHVADVGLFLESCVKMLKPGGLMFVATINRTAKSYVEAIIGAEYVLRLLPVGTHDWKKFLRPSEIAGLLDGRLSILNQCGIRYNPFSGRFSRSDDLKTNYISVLGRGR